MFIEPNYLGSLEVICGGMFSGKTEEFIRRIKRAKYTGYTCGVFKPKLDIRYADNSVVSHNSASLDAISIESSEELLNYDFDIYAIDEVQFMDNSIIDIVNKLAYNKRVIVCGLDMDFTGKPFGPMPQLLCHAEFVTKLHAMTENGMSNYSARIIDNDDQVVLGEKDSYKPMTRKDFYDKRSIL